MNNHPCPLPLVGSKIGGGDITMGSLDRRLGGGGGGYPNPTVGLLGSSFSSASSSSPPSVLPASPTPSSLQEMLVYEQE